MKNIIRVLLIIFAISFTIPVQAYAVPKGYKVVKITKKNASKYFGFKKVKRKDEFGDYNGYCYVVYNKLHKKKYYVYQTKKFALKISHKDRFKWRNDNYTDTNSITQTVTNVGWDFIGYGSEVDYEYGKLLSAKIKKAKGTVIFIKKSNIKGIKKVKYGDSIYYRIKLKYPYDKNTSYESHWNGNKEVIDYYYFEVSKSDFKYI